MTVIKLEKHSKIIGAIAVKYGKQDRNEENIHPIFQASGYKNEVFCRVYTADEMLKIKNK